MGEKMTQKAFWIGIIGLILTGLTLAGVVWSSSINTARENQETRTVVSELKKNFDEYKKATSTKIDILDATSQRNSQGNAILMVKFNNTERLMIKVEDVVTKDLPEIKASLSIIMKDNER